MIHVAERAREMLKETLDDMVEEPDLVLEDDEVSGRPNRVHIGAFSGLTA